MRVLERRPMVDMILSNPPLMILDDDRDISMFFFKCTKIDQKSTFLLWIYVCGCACPSTSSRTALVLCIPNHVLCRVGCLGMHKASAVMLEVLGQAHPHT